METSYLCPQFKEREKKFMLANAYFYGYRYFYFSRLK